MFLIRNCFPICRTSGETYQLFSGMLIVWRLVIIWRRMRSVNFITRL